MAGNTVTGAATGLCTIAANQAGNANYSAATQVTQDITVAAAPPPMISLSPTTLSFGKQHTGSTSATQTVVLSNTGGSTLTIASIAVSVNPSDFVVSGCGSSLGADASCSLSIAFSPTVAGTRLGVVRVIGNAANSSQSANLDGIGVASNLPICTLSAAPARIAPGHSSTLTAICNPTAFSYAWTDGTCKGTSAAICTVTPAATTFYSVTVTGNIGAEFDTAWATVTIKPVNLTPILLLLLD